MKEYNESDFLQLAGIQHFAFCRRQWALIHLEAQWRENLRTTEGHLMHEKVHNSSAVESRGELLIVRGMAVSSRRLGISGQCDAVELRRQPTAYPVEYAFSLQGRTGKFTALPVEYKHGSPKDNPADRLQLCCQALCLEEMLCTYIPEGCLFYGETRRRLKVELTADLRAQAEAMLTEMHDYARRGYTPKVKRGKSCNACSLKEICLPQLMKERSVHAYVNEHILIQPEEPPCDNC